MPFKYLTAITANSFQELPRQVLTKNGFKQVITFKSSHGGDQTLTLWYKTRKEKIPTSKTEIYLPTYNCTIDYGDIGSNKIFIIAADNLKDKQKYKPNFIRIPKTPIWYSVKDIHIVEGKSTGKWKPIKPVKLKYPIVKMAAPDIFK